MSGAGGKARSPLKSIVAGSISGAVEAVISYPTEFGVWCARAVRTRRRRFRRFRRRRRRFRRHLPRSAARRASNFFLPFPASQ